MNTKLLYVAVVLGSALIYWLIMSISPTRYRVSRLERPWTVIAFIFSVGLALWIVLFGPGPKL